MQMRVARGSLLVAVIGLAVVGEAARGQSITSPYRFVDQSQSAGVFGGYFTTSTGFLDLGPNSGPVFGLRYGIRLSGPFTVEADAGYFPTTRTVLDTALAEIRRVGEVDMNLAVVNAALRFNLTGPRTWHLLQPFLVAGVGAAIDLSGTSAFEEENVESDVRFDFGTSFAGQIGGGIEWYPTDRFTLRLDARNLLWKVETPLIFLGGAFGEGIETDEWLHNGFFTLGISIRF
jgi:outer membrane protein with beta-barrel domain